MRIPLFFNNTARSARVDRFRRWLDSHRELFNVIEPESRKDMLHHLAAQADAGQPVVAVAGGDGTLGVAARALCNTETVLASFPAGTMNVFSREIGIRQDFDHALHVLNTGRSREVDLFAFNGQPFLQMAGIGADARAVELTTWEMKKKWKAFAYVIAGARVCVERQPRLTLTTDDGRVLEGGSILFGNGRRYGGPLNFFAEAGNDDGLLDAVVFQHSISSIIGECLLAAVHGGFHSRRNGRFEYIQMTGGTVTSVGQAACELDGDYAGTAPVRITRHGTLKVLVP
ncbi:diacylglycerol kinase family protein [Akkermansia sp.]|uniref:diacylglycerol/lipid kinase family protein n=1 Tax=Akkermansia sp. TaxID=1872421 RepID=UPI0025C5075D|nr:diacylglycerol kinase family protein [Akkermansia sp.]MCC8149370.1 hypothetical protein [Akkermansia sp.]